MIKLVNILKEINKGNSKKLLNESQTLYHRGKEKSQTLIIPDDLGEINTDDFVTALEFAIDGSMSGIDYEINKEYDLNVVDQRGDDPTKLVYFKFKQKGEDVEVDPDSIRVEMDEISRLTEAKKAKETFEEFATTRAAGAAKIASTAEEKGGLAMLTYNHFYVKAPYYKKAINGKFDKEAAKKEFAEILKSISLDMNQNEFQRQVGKMEVLGELLIREN